MDNIKHQVCKYNECDYNSDYNKCVIIVNV